MRMPTDQEYTIAELASIAGVTPRTVRYYISLGLLPPPEQAGPATRYGESHLQRVRLIRRLQDAHLPLAEIRRQTESMDDADIATALAEGSTGPQESALDYIQALRAGTTRPSSSRVLRDAPGTYLTPRRHPRSHSRPTPTRRQVPCGPNGSASP